MAPVTPDPNIKPAAHAKGRDRPCEACDSSLEQPGIRLPWGDGERDAVALDLHFGAMNRAVRCRLGK